MKKNTNNAVFLGVAQAPSPRVPFGFSAEGNALTVAKMGSGKTRCVVVPNMILAHGSVIASDFKSGEVAALTALYRRWVLGQRTVVFDPFKVVGNLPGVERGHLDPVQYVRNSPHPMTAAFVVAQAIIPPGGHRETHWGDSAQNLLVAMMLFVAFDPTFEQIAVALGMRPEDARTMRTLKDLLLLPRSFRVALEMMIVSENAFVADQASAFYKAPKANTEIQSIRNHLRTNIARTFSEDAILDTLSGTNVDFTALGKEAQTMFFVLPAQLAETHSRYMRLLNIIAISEIERAGLNPLVPTTFELDETIAFGNMTPLTGALARLRGYNCRVHLYLQSISQLKPVYGDNAELMKGLAQCTQFFGGTNDVDTANYISEICGTQTIVTTAPNWSNSPGAAGGGSQSTTGRRLYMPDEVMRLEMPKQIIKIAGEQATEIDLIAPDLSDFPQYSAFMHRVERGMEPAEAAIAVRGLPAWRAPVAPPAAPIVVPQPPKKTPFNVAAFLDGALRRVLNQDTE